MGLGSISRLVSLIKAMVEVMQPKPGMTINDPACGTGGFIIAAHNYLSANPQLDLEQKRFLRFKTFTGKDIVDGVVRLCVMNLFLHGIDGEVDQPAQLKRGILSFLTRARAMIWF